MEDSGENLDPKKQQAILALLSSRSIEEAARASETPASTLYRWMKDPEFDRAYREAKRQAFGQAIARLHQMSGAAAATLGKVMVDPNTPPAVKVRAADSILNHTNKAIELEDIEARLAALERTTEASKK